MAPTDDLPCRDLVELVTDYLEDVLGLADRRRFEAHLVECDACATYVEQLRATVDVAGRVPPAELSPAVRAHLRSVFRNLSTTGFE
jgi:anti-sigma factor RsiW